MSTLSRPRTQALVKTAAAAAVLCITGPVSVFIGPVPVSLTNLSVFLLLYACGARRATGALCVYIALGACVLPVFSGFGGGLFKLLGPTGGYILGFVPMALLAGAALRRSTRRSVHLAGMAAGMLACYALGTAWFCLSTGTPLVSALGACVFPFVPIDAAKMALCALLGPEIARRLSFARL